MTDIMEVRRKGFEEKAFAQRFLSSIKRVHSGQFGLQPVTCPTKKEFVAKDAEGNYIEESLNYAWWAWNAALDTVCLELPGYPATCDMTSTLICETIDQCAKAIERAGLKVKP